MTPPFRALRVHQAATGSECRLETLDVEDLSAGDVVIRTRWAGVNYKDSLAVTGQAKVLSGSPRVPGIELVGVVEHSASADLAVGAEVIVHGWQTGIEFDGGFAERVRAPAAHVMALPAGLSAREAAVLGVPAFTVAVALDRFEAAGLTPASGPVAVSGASGAVGMAAIAILRRAGYEVVALSRREAWRLPLLQLGASQVLLVDSAVEDRRPLERAQFAAAIDNVGGPVLSWLLRSLKDRGQLASVGNAGGIGFSSNVLPFILRQATMFGVVANAPWPVRHRLWAQLAGGWRPLLSALEPHVQEIRLDDLPAHCAQQVAGRSAGRTLVRFDH
jgi:putative YhdH/YhfP family quinone oxidoreductase